MGVVNALQIRGGKQFDSYTKYGTLTQPSQFLPQSKKDEEWVQTCINWYELQGVKQIKLNSKKFLKNIRLAYGIIDKSDYIMEENTEEADLLNLLTKEEDSALELKFYPIIPNVINVLTGEFSKRSSKASYIAVDDESVNEMLEEKRLMLEQTLVAEATNKLYIKLLEQNVELSDEEIQEALSVENVKTLPEIENFFKKSYRSIYEIWASHQHNVDVERFNFQELEERQFKRSLILDREFWHFKMNEDDYEIEDWDPVFTFYHKSPDIKYISDGNWVGKIDLMAVPDVIDKYGWLMTENQLKSLEKLYPAANLSYAMSGTGNNGSLYDTNKSYAWNTNMPSYAARQLYSMYDNWTVNGDIVDWLIKEDESYQAYGNTNLIRVCTVYWKTQRKLFNLTKITEEGEIIKDIVDETYKITEKPLYDTTYYLDKTKDNLLVGEHLEPLWVNEVWGGVKIGPNRPPSWTTESSDINPIYIGINRNKPCKLPFQFKGDYTPYGCKLPVEGTIFSDRNIKSTSLVDLMKPHQVGFNLVNNQIADILIDELGSIILLDQNMLPKQSGDESWGRHNYAKAYLAMKDFSMLPVDTSMQNTEGASGFNQFTVLNLEQTARLRSRIELANYFKQEALSVVGITPQRLGTVLASESATGVQQAVNNSYAQTEKYFTQHTEYLMPRVHQMRTNLAQYYHSTNPSLRLQYITSTDERVNFKINGTKLLMKDLNVFYSTKLNHKEIMNQLKQLALNNNTSGASIYDLGNIIKADSMSEIDLALKKVEEKQRQVMQQEQEHQKQLEQMRIESETQLRKEEQEREDLREQKRNETDILVAQINAAGRNVDTTDNGNDEFIDRLNIIQKQSQFQEVLNQKRESDINKLNMEEKKLQIRREEVAAQRDRSNKMLQIAREQNINKNKEKNKPKNK